MISIKTPEEINLMRESGRIAGRILKATCEQVKVGVSTLELNNLAEDLMRQNNVDASFKTVGKYQFGTCINVNCGVVHGLPSKDVILKPGDVVKIDLGVIYKGWHSDTADTVFLPSADEAQNKIVNRFLEVGRETLRLAIDQCRAGNHVSDISSVIEENIEIKNGYSVNYELTGHGLGRTLHESPDIPGVLVTGPNYALKDGMTVAIEIIYSLGDGAIKTAKDGWTMETKDGSISGLFEHSIAITSAGPKILTDPL